MDKKYLVSVASKRVIPVDQHEDGSFTYSDTGSPVNLYNRRVFDDYNEAVGFLLSRLEYFVMAAKKEYERHLLDLKSFKREYKC